MGWADILGDSLSDFGSFVADQTANTDVGNWVAPMADAPKYMPTVEPSLWDKAGSLWNEYMPDLSAVGKIANPTNLNLLGRMAMVNPQHWGQILAPVVAANQTAKEYNKFGPSSFNPMQNEGLGAGTIVGGGGGGKVSSGINAVDMSGGRSIIPTGNRGELPATRGIDKYIPRGW